MIRRWIAAAFSLSVLLASAPPVLAQSAQPQVQQVSQTTAGPWSVIGWRSSDNIAYCTAERSVGDVRIAFVRVRQGFGLLIHSPTWQLDPNSAVPVQVARRLGHSSFSGRAITSNIVLVPLDEKIMSFIAEQQQIVVTAGEVTVTIPLDSIAAALTALRDCVAHAENPQAPGAPAPSAQPAPFQQPSGGKPGTVNAPRARGPIQVP